MRAAILHLRSTERKRNDENFPQKSKSTHTGLDSVVGFSPRYRNNPVPTGNFSSQTTHAFNPPCIKKRLFVWFCLQSINARVLQFNAMFD